MKFKRKYFVNNNFFEKWSDTMAYILGFWWADGCICGDIFSISQKSSDKYILEEISLNMKSTYRLYECNNSYSFSIRSPKIVESLKKMGATERKSKKLIFPFVPKKYLSHFIRGLWDGDGSIALQTGRKSYHASLTSGNKGFLEQVNKVLTCSIKEFRGGSISTVVCKRGKKMPMGQVLKKDSTYYMLRLGVNDTKKLGKFIYGKCECLCLERKAEIFRNLSPIKLATYQKEFLSYKEAKIKVKKINIKTWEEWRKYVVSGKKPSNIPSFPNRTYRGEFINMKDFLGAN